MTYLVGKDATILVETPRPLLNHGELVDLLREAAGELSVIHSESSPHRGSVERCPRCMMRKRIDAMLEAAPVSEVPAQEVARTLERLGTERVAREDVISVSSIDVAAQDMSPGWQSIQAPLTVTLTLMVPNTAAYQDHLRKLYQALTPATYDAGNITQVLRDMLATHTISEGREAVRAHAIRFLKHSADFDIARRCMRNEDADRGIRAVVNLITDAVQCE